MICAALCALCTFDRNTTTVYGFFCVDLEGLFVFLSKCWRCCLFAISVSTNLVLVFLCFLLLFLLCVCV